MKKSFLAGMLSVVMLAAVLAAGCTFPTTSSPTSTPSSQNVSQYLTTMMQERNFTMMTPFSFQPSPQTGMAVYNGTASDNNGTYAVSVQAWNNAQTAQAQFVALKTMFMGQGYAVVQENATAWLGFNANTRTHHSCHTTRWSSLAVLSGKRPSNRLCGSTCGTLCTRRTATVAAWACTWALE